MPRRSPLRLQPPNHSEWDYDRMVDRAAFHARLGVAYKAELNQAKRKIKTLERELKRLKEGV